MMRTNQLLTERQPQAWPAFFTQTVQRMGLRSLLAALALALVLLLNAAPPAHALPPQDPTSCAVVGWGNTSYGQTTPPAGLSDVVAIAAGITHSLALKSDGTVVGWGDNEYGQATPPVGLSDVVAIADGESHSLALKADGTVVGWGRNDYGEATPPANLSDVVAIAAGGSFSLALKSDGTVVGWGTNINGSLNIPAGLSNVVAISAGSVHSLALKLDGTIIGWGGSNSYGQTTTPAGLTNVVAISAGSVHSLALKSDGTVIGWGRNNVGQATPPAGLSDVVAIDVGSSHNLALKSDGTVVGWGSSSFGQATPPAGLSNVIAIAAGGYHSLAAISACAPTNNPPIVAADNASVTVNEGQTATNTGTVSDSDGDTVTLSASVGTAVNNNDGTWSWSFATSSTADSQTVTISADDGNGGIAQTTFDLTVNAVAIVNARINGTDCNLIDAVTAANTDTATGACAAGTPGADTIELLDNVTLVSLSGFSGLPQIISEITINGSGFTIARDAGAPNFVIIALATNGTLTLNDTTITGGRSTGGGGFFNRGILTLNNSTVSGNSVDSTTGTPRGGGIINLGTVTLNNSTISNNTALEGGAIHNSGTVTLNNSTVSGNSGGGIYGSGGSTLTLTNSTVSGNSSTVGGGIINLGTGTLNNSTVSGNSADFNGGGIFNEGLLTLERSLISGNSAPSGSEIYNSAGFPPFSPPGTLNSDNFNLFGHSGALNAQAIFNLTPGASDITATSDGTNPSALASILDTTLQVNAPGNTATYALVTGSPAIDAATSGLATDQRGVTRPQGCGFDIGAYELEQPLCPPANQAPIVAADNASVTVNEGQTATNTGTVDDADGDTVTLNASVGTVVNNNDGTWSWSFATTDGPADSQTVTISADDGNGGVSETSFDLIVNNVAPTIASVSNDGPITAGGVANITVDASDPAGAADPLAYEFDCDNNGSYEVGPQAGNSTACTFAGAGDFPVSVRVSDGDGGEATGATVVTVNPANTPVASCGDYAVEQTPGGSYVAAGWSGNIMVGTNGNNTLNGANGPDLILGLGGNDLLKGKGGDDVICGSDGVDLLLGDGGNDYLDGGNGNNVLNGGSGDYDVLIGGAGNDVLLDGNGVLSAQGGPGNDAFTIALRFGWRDPHGQARFDGIAAGYGNDAVGLAILNLTHFFVDITGDERDDPPSPLEGNHDALGLVGVIDPASTIIKFEHDGVISGNADEQTPLSFEGFLVDPTTLTDESGAEFLSEPVGEDAPDESEQNNRIFLPLVNR